MMNTCCLKCQRQTKDLNSRGFVTKNKNILLNQYVIFVNLKNRNLFQKKMFLVFLVNYFQKYLF